MATFPDPPGNVVVVDEARLIEQGWLRWFLRLTGLLSRGYTGTVPLAKITGGGADGSLTFVNGILTSVTAPT